MKRKGQESENPVEQEQSAKVSLPHTKENAFATLHCTSLFLTCTRKHIINSLVGWHYTIDFSGFILNPAVMLEKINLQLHVSGGYPPYY